MVLGGTSEIALAIVRELQSRAPREVALVGRDSRRSGRVRPRISPAPAARGR